MNATRDFVEIQRRALELLVTHLRKRKHTTRASAAPERANTDSTPTEHPPAPAPQPTPAAKTPVPPPKRIRRPTAAVARAVWQRDQSRCAYVDDRGQRCRETSMLECHHQQAWAMGGETTVENLELRCRAHNALAAEEDFGREYMRGRADGGLEVVGE